MGLYDSQTYLQDLDLVIDNNQNTLRELRGTRILITGASGLVCSPIVDLILRSNNRLGTDIDLYLAGRSEERLKKRFPGNKFTFVPYDATEKNHFDFHTDYIIHGASNSGPKDIAARGIETMLDNFNGMYELLEFASRESAKNTLYISSSEVYGKKKSIEPFTEDEYGDILDVNSDGEYEINGQKVKAADLMEAFYELFIK